MVRLLHERVLLIGDAQRDVQSALAEALPGAQVTSVPTLFDGIAELSGNRFTTVLAAAEPMERRPEAAVRTLRELAGEARLLLFGHPTLEILSRKMMEFGCDDYVITPASPGEFQQVFGKPPMRIARPPEATDHTAASSEGAAPANASLVYRLGALPLADILLDAMLQHPADAVQAAVKEIHQRIAPDLELSYTKPGAPAPGAVDGQTLMSHPIRQGEDEIGSLHLSLPVKEDESAARHALSEIARQIGKVAALQERHNRLQRLAITDELTGLSNARYFRHFLSLILERARKMHFPVTLLLFDIDDFKQYNDEFGHKTGDEILKQAAALMKRCVRQHDLVARIGGDEFAVVFWDKEGPRQPRQPKPNTALRPPQEPLQVFERFKGLISSEEFPSLGQTGKGSLTVSAGLAVFPWDATSVDALIDETDRRLMRGAKRNGKNAIYIVGTDDPTAPGQAGI
ncbi:MAG TPA: GGDEF domain-containing protein [Tepidisphaeraceae bacterium]|jgi:GGDEF domain-containing protein